VTHRGTTDRQWLELASDEPSYRSPEPTVTARVS